MPCRLARIARKSQPPGWPRPSGSGNAALGGGCALPGANRKVGTIGDCLGGRLAFMMAVQSDADVNVSDYGVGLDDLLGDRAKVAETLVVAPGQRPEAWCAAWMRRATSATGR